TAYWAIKRGDVKAHKRKMITLYFGAIIIAGGFTFFPGRYLHQLFFG
ncbi:MAG: putative membrane protein, partial [Luteibaculaceae bacterium]